MRRRNGADERKQRIGIFGGTFDPPHIGHLWLAETAREQLELDRILFCPVGKPPHKTGHVVTAPQHRLAMVRLSIASNASYTANTTDIDRSPPHTTATLIPLLQAQCPPADFWLLIGSDGLRDFSTWHEPTRVLQRCRLGVLPRPDVIIDWAQLQRDVPNIIERVDMLIGPTADISGTDLRNWAWGGHSLRYLVQDEIRDYIEAHELYRK